MTDKTHAEEVADAANRAVRRFLYDEDLRWHRMTDEEIQMTALFATRRRLPILRRRALEALSRRRRAAR